MTLLELMLASSIMLLFAATISTLAVAVQQSSEYEQGVAAATQHGRVVIGRIERAVRTAHASSEFPGCLVVARRIGPALLLDTLVVWRGDVAVSDPDGLPLRNELVVYCPDPASPNRLLEITDPNDYAPAPPVDDLIGWRRFVRHLKEHSGSKKTELTDRLRAPVINQAVGRRGAVRFHLMYRPSAVQLQQYEAGALDWSELPWAQGIHSDRFGLRQTWCSIELQLVADPESPDPDSAVIPFVGSAAKYYAVRQG